MGTHPPVERRPREPCNPSARPRESHQPTVQSSGARTRWRPPRKMPVVRRRRAAVAPNTATHRPTARPPLEGLLELHSTGNLIRCQFHAWPIPAVAQTLAPADAAEPRTLPAKERVQAPAGGGRVNECRSRVLSPILSVGYAPITRRPRVGHASVTRPRRC